MINKSIFNSLKLIHAKLQQEKLVDQDISKEYSQEKSRRWYSVQKDGGTREYEQIINARVIYENSKQKIEN